jgi:hypothetical protein
MKWIVYLLKGFRDIDGDCRPRKAHPHWCRWSGRLICEPIDPDEVTYG